VFVNQHCNTTEDELEPINEKFAHTEKKSSLKHDLIY